jgi:hypothetical protein
MRDKFKGRDFAAITISIDNPADREEREKVDRVLSEKHVTAPAYILKEPREETLKRLGDIEGPPCLYLFNRDNRYVRKYVGEEDFKVIEAEVEKLLK